MADLAHIRFGLGSGGSLSPSNTVPSHHLPPFIIYLLTVGLLFLNCCSLTLGIVRSHSSLSLLSVLLSFLRTASSFTSSFILLSV